MSPGRGRGALCLWDVLHHGCGLGTITDFGSIRNLGVTTAGWRMYSRLFSPGCEHDGQGVDWTPASLSQDDVLLAPQSLLPELVGAGRQPPSLRL